MHIRKSLHLFCLFAMLVLLMVVLPATPGEARPATQAADCGYTPEDGGVPKDGLGVLDKCVTDTLGVDGVTKRLVVFYTDTGGPVYDPTGAERGAGADSCSDGADNDADGDTDSDDSDCLIDHRVTQAKAQAVLDAAVGVWQRLTDLGFKSPRHDGGQGTDDGSSDDKDNRFDVWIEFLEWTIDDGAGGRTRKSAWGVAWWEPSDHISVDAALARLDEGSAEARKATTYHEMWHRVQYSYDYDEMEDGYPANAWQVEGSARHMQDEISADVDNDSNGRFIDDADIYLGQPDRDLREWEYKAGLWWKYYAEQTGDDRASDPGLGVDAVVTLWDLTFDFDGLATVEQAVQDESGLTLEQLWQRFTLANYTKDYASADPRYSYIDDDGPGLAWDSVALFAVNEADIIASVPNDPAVSIDQDPWAARYFETRVNFAPDCRAFHYTVTSLGDNPAPVGLDVVTIAGITLQDHASRVGTQPSVTFLNRGYSKATGVVTTFGDSANYRVEYGCAVPTIAEIERPQTEGAGVPAQAGPFDDPHPFTVRLRVSDESDGATIAGLRPEDFIVRVSGTPAEVLGGAYVFDRYWLSVMPPAQPADGLYDLRVELVDSGSAATNVSSVRYSSGEPHDDVIHVLDVSGSMDGEKLDAARQAFKLLVNELAVGDYGGLVSFSGDGSELKWNDFRDWVTNVDATADFTLQEIPDDATRTLLRDSVDPLVANGWTSIGDGLLTAVDQYENKGVAEHQCAVILLSDGAENEATLYADDPLTPQLPYIQLQGAGCRVDTIAFGEGTDEALMQRIAEDHSGDYYYAPDNGAVAQAALAGLKAPTPGPSPNLGEGELSSPLSQNWERGARGERASPQSTSAIPNIAWQNELARTFDHAITRAAGRQRIQSFWGSMDQPVAVEYNVSDADHMLMLALKWVTPVTPGDDVRMQIFDPDGNELRPTNRGCAPYGYAGTERYCAETNEVVRIERPQPGTWRVQILAQKPSDYVLMGNVRSDLQLEVDAGAPTAVFANGTTILQGHRVPIVALLTSPKGPVRGADVQALIQKPDGVLASVRLYDDGNHDDGDLDDGFYGNTFYEAIEADVPAGQDRQPWDEGKEPDVRGSYKVTATALFDSLRREAQTSFAISEDLDSDGDGMSDTWENYFDPNWATTPNATDDVDLDGLTNLEEYQRGTHPLMSDTDQGGESDGSEVAHSQDPLDPDDDAVSSVLDFDLLPDNGVIHVLFNMQNHNAYRVWRRTLSGAAAAATTLGLTALSNTVATPDSTGNVGSFTSLTLDGAGNPVVSYYDGSNGNLKVLHCGTPDCTSGNAITAPDGATTNVGWYTSLALDSAGNPVVSYYDITNKNLKVLHCGNSNCSSGNVIATPDSAGDVGMYSALALDSSGRPVVAYRDEDNGDIKVLRCGNANCTSGNSVFRIATPSNEGFEIAMTLDVNDKPVITYHETVSGDLRFRHCANVDCTDQTSGTFRALDVDGITGRVSSVVLNSDGYPVVSFADRSWHLKLVRCNDANCATYSSHPDLDTNAAFVDGTSVALDVNDFPAIAYHDAVNGDLKLLHCGDAICSGSNTIATSDTAGNAGMYTSLALDAAGRPVVSYHEFDNRDLRVLHCANTTCAADETAWQVVAEGTATPNTRVTVDDAVENGQQYAYRVQGFTNAAGAAALAGGTDLQALQAQDVHAGGLSGDLSATAKSDPVPPEGSIVIDDDARNTMSRLVTLSLPAWDEDTYGAEGLEPAHGTALRVTAGADQPAEMRIRNDSRFPADENADWIPYQSSVANWDMGSPTSGSPARVYVQFRDAAGNISLTQADSIIYCQPDRNGDGVIGVVDIQAFAGRWGITIGSPDYNPLLDMDGDGDTDTVDVMLVARDFGGMCD